MKKTILGTFNEVADKLKFGKKKLNPIEQFIFDYDIEVATGKKPFNESLAELIDYVKNENGVEEIDDTVKRLAKENLNELVIEIAKNNNIEEVKELFNKAYNPTE